MKFKSLVVCLLLNLTSFAFINATPNTERQSIAVLRIDAQGFPFDAAQMVKLTQVELMKLDVFNVVDRHDVEYVLSTNNIDPNNCYSTACLIDLGKKLKADLVLTGSVDIISDKIVVNFRLIDIALEQVIKTSVQEYLNLQEQVRPMVGLTLGKMFNRPVDQDLQRKLTVQDDYSSTVNVPGADQLNLSGPRLGLTIFTGDLANLYRMPKEEGGFGVSSVMFQFGYQFEVQYLNTGDIQALFEFIPIVTGLDQGLFIPSVSMLHGLRSNKTGFELAFGPIFSIVNTRNGIPAPKGDPTFKAGFVFGFGKSFKSGRMNFPVNAFFIPGKSGHRYGLSVGFNMVSTE
ncbi:MAG: hypothetical protein EP344_09005 [Bacteroidetes bacterium]|nr:MAG: hypothetical protein EP344_09005 [Bacteroidota bacterium]